MAGAGPLMGISAMALAPNGPVGSCVGTRMETRSGMSVAGRDRVVRKERNCMRPPASNGMRSKRAVAERLRGGALDLSLRHVRVDHLPAVHRLHDLQHRDHAGLRAHLHLREHGRERRRRLEGTVLGARVAMICGTDRPGRGRIRVIDCERPLAFAFYEFIDRCFFKMNIFQRAPLIWWLIWLPLAVCLCRYFICAEGY